QNFGFSVEAANKGADQFVLGAEMVPDRRRISLARGGANLPAGNGRDPVLGEEPFSRVENERPGLSLSLRGTGLAHAVPGLLPDAGGRPPTADRLTGGVVIGDFASSAGSALPFHGISSFLLAAARVAVCLIPSSARAR